MGSNEKKKKKKKKEMNVQQLLARGFPAQQHGAAESRL
jgi:hypothetical protein